jgi:Zn-dependent peptidase ImmA (M78 family)
VTSRYSPWRHLRSLAHINLRWTDDDEELDAAHGWYYVDHDEIVIDSRLSQRERRSVLSHELAHAIGRDEPCHNPVLDSIQELRADRWAARRLIDIRSLGEALAWASDLEEAAEELWVTRDLLDVRLAHLHPSERAYLMRRLEHST